MISKLILGTVQFGLNYGINNPNGLIPHEKTYNILKFAEQSGISILDTASDYGESEKKIGAFNRGENRFKIITKFSKRDDIDWKTSLYQSIENLQVDTVDTVMFHSFSSYNQAQLIIKNILREAKGKWFSKLGVSVYTNEELSALAQDKYIDVIQCPFNLLDNHSQRAQDLITLKESGKIVHTRSVFLQGLFFMNSDNLPDNLLPLSPYCKKIHTIASENHLSVGHLALQYALKKKYIDGVLIGVDSVEQLKANIQWAQTSIPDNILSLIDNIRVDNITLLNPSKW